MSITTLLSTAVLITNVFASSNNVVPTYFRMDYVDSIGSNIIIKDHDKDGIIDSVQIDNVLFGHLTSSGHHRYAQKEFGQFCDFKLNSSESDPWYDFKKLITFRKKDRDAYDPLSYQMNSIDAYHFQNRFDQGPVGAWLPGSGYILSREELENPTLRDETERVLIWSSENNK